MVHVKYRPLYSFNTEVPLNDADISRLYINIKRELNHIQEWFNIKKYH